MLNKTCVLTSIVAALFMAVSLKFLHFFMFINWSPFGWSSNWGVFTTEYIIQTIVNWLLLIVALSVLFAIVYIGFSFLYKIPPTISALIIGLLFVLVTEWLIHEPISLNKAIESMSIPLLAISAIVFRFIAGTAVFMKGILNESIK